MWQEATGQTLALYGVLGTLRGDGKYSRVNLSMLRANVDMESFSFRTGRGYADTDRGGRMPSSCTSGGVVVGLCRMNAEILRATHGGSGACVPLPLLPTAVVCSENVSVSEVPWTHFFVPTSHRCEYTRKTTEVHFHR
jgi:hypothetical protein